MKLRTISIIGAALAAVACGKAPQSDSLTQWEIGRAHV